ncbi:MAG: 3-hydroxyacyl-CoA dehydrogenase NAD-binding domain-containing protein [Myxococcota bacterium]|nr:3-hydroxyacyl-CoA dehydrogenase NAD-binding domain-containing protein [Myxococcota bacterium]
MDEIAVNNPSVTLTVDRGVATLTLTHRKVNKLDPGLPKAVNDGLDAALAVDGLQGIILTSGHRDFCVGADLEMLGGNQDPVQILSFVRVLNAMHRRIETCGVSVVAAVTGAALGGGFELALACHHIACVESARVGLPEVQLGVMPGAGGTQRMPWRLGLQGAMENLAAGTTWRAPKALKVHAIDSVHATREDMLAAADQWIRDNPGAKQPWDRPKPQMPGGVQPGSAASMQLFVGASAFLYKKSAGAFPGAEAVVETIAQGTKMARFGAFDQAIELEARRFVALASSPQARFMIRSLWHFKSAAERFDGLQIAPEHGVSKVAILGAGMMGGGLAFVCAKAGFEVVVKDIAQPALADAQEHCEKELAKLKWLTVDQRAEIAARLSFTLETEPLRGADLVIEAVVEKLEVKHAVTREIEPLLAPGAIWASNTSALPIADLAQASAAPERFVGLHFFSPVEKMPLLEVIDPPGCSAETVARALAFGKAIGKTCIVVGDGYGFFTTRLFAAYLLEGAQLVAEGYNPAAIEWAAREQGMVMPPLKVFDEVTLTLGAHAFENRAAYLGKPLELEAVALIGKLVALGRTGKAAGAGFYDWSTRRTWEGLADVVGVAPKSATAAELGRRLMLAQAAEVGRILDDGVIRDRRHVEVGAILGLGFAPNTGGPLSWMEAQGLEGLVAEMEAAAQAWGERFAPSGSIQAAAKAGGFFE